MQEDVADGVIEMLKGAMDTLIVGDPGDPATDVGPVIDRAAYDRLMAYREQVRGRWLKTVDVPAKGLFVPPTLIRLDRIEDLTAEWFGPILHVATWKAGELAETIARVNAKGYGLTMGLHSRIARAGEVVEAEAAGGQPLHQPVDDRRGGGHRSRSAARGCRAPGRRRAGRITCTASAPSGRCRSTRPARAAMRRC